VAHDRIPVHRGTGLVLETQPKVIDDGGGVNVWRAKKWRRKHAAEQEW
jgi:hypothetical protein